MILEAALLALAWMALTGDWSVSAAVFSVALGWLLLRFARPLGGKASGACGFSACPASFCSSSRSWWSPT